MPDAYESFNQPDSAVLGPNHAWAKVGDGADNMKTIGNRLDGTMANATSARARAEVAMVSDDHYAELQIVELSKSSIGSSSLGVFIRASTTAASHGDFYGAELNSAGKVYFYKMLAGVRTSFLDGTAFTIGTLPGTLRLQARGSTITLLWRGAVVHEVTDTSIPGSPEQRGTGVIGYQLNNSGKGDEFRSRTPIKPLVVSGSLAPSGSLAAQRQILVTFAGSVAAAGALSTRVTRILSVAGRIDVTATTSKLATKNRIGKIKGAGALRRGMSKSLSGSVTPSGTPGVVFLGRVLGRAGAVIMEIRRAGEIRMRFRGR